jgi:hypothetical protein
VAYGRKVFGLGVLLSRVTDRRRRPVVEASWVAATVFFAGLLRIRSFNALEPRLSEKAFRRLVGTGPNESLGSADTLSRALRKMDLDSVRAVSRAIIAKAERNKVFREGWHGTLRYMAIDGWEPISSEHRHCRHCLVRRVTRKARDGSVRVVDQYYHRFAVAMLIGPEFDLLLDLEPLLPADLRPAVAKGKKSKRIVRPKEDEGELTAAMRLLRRVKQTFGWVDVVVGDGLYSNGPFLSLVDELGMGAITIARKETDEPLREAMAIWQIETPQVIQDGSETIELWDCPDLETLTTYDGRIRVVRGCVTREDRPEPSTWCLLATGLPSRRLPAQKLLAIARGRWHIENTGFHQWSTHWQFTHVFVHDGNGIKALYWLFFAAYNLLTLFLYRVRAYGRHRGKDVTRTISRFVDQLRDDLARLELVAWDTS